MKIHVLSERAACGHVSWSNNYEFEDVIASTCDAEIISPSQFLAHTRWEPVTQRLRKGRYRKVDPPESGGADLLIVIAMGPPGLRMLNALSRWRQKYERVVAYIPDIYPPSEEQLDRGIANQLDALFIGYSQMVQRVSAIVNPPVYHLQQAADVLGGLPARSEKPLDVAAFGRQPSGLVAALSHAAGAPDSRLLAWWSPGSPPYSKTMKQDRSMFLSMLRATRIALCFRFEDSHPNVFRGVSPYTARWFEAAAAGCVVAGSAPTCPEASSPVSIPTSRISSIPQIAMLELQDLLMSGNLNDMARASLQLARNHHDWRHRLEQMLTTLGIEVPAVLAREISELASV